MVKSLVLVSLLATAAAVHAQTAEPAPPETAATSSQGAPIVRAYPSNQAPQTNSGSQPTYTRQVPGMRASVQGRRRQQWQGQIVDSQPVMGVWLRSRTQSVVKTVSATPHGTEIRVEQGILNVNVHHPADHTEILVDLPGGQASLLKDGLYTFNADTKTLRVLHGEAAAYEGAGRVGKPIKVKEGHQLAFLASGQRIKPVEAYPYELTADLLPMGGIGDGGGSGYADYSGDDGPYGYPDYGGWGYGGWGYAGGYGFYPYGFYPYGYGIGIGYYGGFGGGFRGGRVGFRR